MHQHSSFSRIISLLAVPSASIQLSSGFYYLLHLSPLTYLNISYNNTYVELIILIFPFLYLSILLFYHLDQGFYFVITVTRGIKLFAGWPLHYLIEICYLFVCSKFTDFFIQFLNLITVFILSFHHCIL